jgi:hypothetical protein
MIKEGSQLWQFLSPQEQMLYNDGVFLLEDSKKDINPEPTDFSYLVFPFAKLYEGFLKDYFLTLGIISRRDYESNHFRIGKVLSPNLIRRLGRRSAYGQIQARFGIDLANKLWIAWKEGRNQVFHYFPQSYRTLTHTQAEQAIDLILQTMELAVKETNVRKER